jgi:predicted dehydrogenase
VLGDAGAFVSHGLDEQEPALRAGASPRDPGFGQRAGVATFHDGSGEPVDVPMEAGRWVDYYAGLVAAIRDDAPPPVTAQEAVGVLELLEAARESSTRGLVVAVA